MAFTPQLQLETLFILDEGRIRCTREPTPQPGPAFALVRGVKECAWAVSAAVPTELKDQFDALARDEPLVSDFARPPRHAQAYLALLGGKADSGPVFTFPPTLVHSGDVAIVTDIAELNKHFRGWTADEIPDRSPIVGIIVDGEVVSVCFCARRSDIAAEAGVETAPEFRGKGLAAQVTTAWARLIQQSGRLPLYSTSWDNRSSLAVARRLQLSMCASDWSLFAASIGG